MIDDPHRRAFIASAIACLGAPLPALARIDPVCVNDPAISDMAKPLTIDTHTHFFNGRDLQVKEFLSQTTVGPDSELYPLVKGLGGMLQGLAWHLAPDAQSERRAMAQYADRLRHCTGASQLRGIADPAFEQGYALGRAELQRTASELKQTSDGAAVLAAKPGDDGLGAVIDALPASYDAFETESTKGTSVLGSNPSLLGYVQFVLHHFNHRHVNAIDYLTTYSRNSPRKVDLAVASMVDFDWWLAKGAATPTPLSEQTELMTEMSVLLGGRVHGFVAYCPFRELRTLDAQGVGDGMRMVKRAIEERGFIGVKLYPPMGFAAWGNTGKNVWAGKRSLHASAAAPDFGQRLDAAMASLFRYCVEKDVPIMAHTNHSNGPYPEFKALAGSEYWKLALDKFPGLRVSFGHFGDTDLEDRKGSRTLPFLKLMTKDAGTPGTNTFADSGY
ncbi:amidohydrolase family protein, partial [Massilia cavernae]